MDVKLQLSPANLAPIAVSDYPEFEAFTRMYSFWSDDKLKFKYRGELIEEEEVRAADSSAFKLFSIDMLSGSSKQALQGPNKVVLSSNLARRIFGDEDPLGKLLETKIVHNTSGLDTTYSLIVSGVFKDMPRNTNLFANAFISAETDPELDNYYFGRFKVHTYVLLKEGIDKAPLSGKLTAIYDKYFVDRTG